MPRCENLNCTKSKVLPEELRRDAEGNLLCGNCLPANNTIEVPSVQQDLVFGRELDYEVSYTRESGLRAGIRLGGAKLSFEVDPAELNRTFGPAK